MTEKENTTVTSSNTEKEKVKSNIASISVHTSDIQIDVYCQSPDENITKLKNETLHMFKEVLDKKIQKKLIRGYE